MMPLYAAFTDDAFDSDSEIMEEEGMMGHGIVLMPTIHDKPAALVGSRFVSGGGACGYTNYSEMCTYIDIDGNVIVVHEYTLSADEDTVVLGGRELVTGDEADDELSLDLVQDHFPEAYQGFWDA